MLIVVLLGWGVNGVFLGYRVRNDKNQRRFGHAYSDAFCKHRCLRITTITIVNVCGIG